MASKCSAAEMTYFYPRSPCGERRNKHTIITGGKHFYPRSPCGERPAVTTSITLSLRFLSTLSLRRATQATFCHHWDHHISIHALLAESDSTTIITICIALRFLSTLSLRRATWGVRKAVGSLMDFYPRSPCGERLPSVLHSFRPPRISIHALLAESDN